MAVAWISAKRKKGGSSGMFVKLGEPTLEVVTWGPRSSASLNRAFDCARRIGRGSSGFRSGLMSLPCGLEAQNNMVWSQLEIHFLIYLEYLLYTINDKRSRKQECRLGSASRHLWGAWRKGLTSFSCCSNGRCSQREDLNGNFGQPGRE